MHDLSELVSQTTELFRVGLPPEVQVVFDLGRVLPGVKCDGIQIRQVLMNLILNGAEAIGDRPGRVTIRTREVTMGREELLQRFQREDMEPGTYVCVEVADTGCGMDPTTAARIFDPFFSTKKSGRGLGLAATLHILRNHGGALSLRSQVGSGTTFELIFPAVQDSCLTGAELPAQKTILLVDDEEAVRGVTRELLTRSGYEVLPADSAESALELVKHHRGPLHAAVLDWTLPGMDGKELGRQLRRTYPAIPIILMSGFHPRDARAHWDEDCPCVFLQKPFQLKDLEERLERLICASS